MHKRILLLCAVSATLIIFSLIPRLPAPARTMGPEVLDQELDRIVLSPQTRDLLEGILERPTSTPIYGTEVFLSNCRPSPLMRFDAPTWSRTEGYWQEAGRCARQEIPPPPRDPDIPSGATVDLQIELGAILAAGRLALTEGDSTTARDWILLLLKRGAALLEDPSLNHHGIGLRAVDAGLSHLQQVAIGDDLPSREQLEDIRRGLPTPEACRGLVKSTLPTLVHDQELSDVMTQHALSEAMPLAVRLEIARAVAGGGESRAAHFFGLFDPHEDALAEVRGNADLAVHLADL